MGIWYNGWYSCAPVFDPVLGAGSAPVSDIIGAVGGEFISNVVKDEVKKNDKKK
ncbi:hypothetical protein [Pantoea piersonii]|uniref:hypothetical protein n=1 Tax=Pantoea piersonii TaxID=2364647 RepID=UPI0022F15833|nr:hypothetical protein [Pantoea piersonii]WBV22407.1 hypothetical protein PG877_04360 [Pantoea piersonii]